MTELLFLQGEDEEKKLQFWWLLILYLSDVFCVLWASSYPCHCSKMTFRAYKHVICDILNRTAFCFQGISNYWCPACINYKLSRQGKSPLLLWPCIQFLTAKFKILSHAPKSLSRFRTLKCYHDQFFEELQLSSFTVILHYLLLHCY